VKKPQHSSFKFSPVAVAVAIAITSQFAGNVAQAGSGYGSGVTNANVPNAISTYYANSPSGPAPQWVGGALQQRTDGSALPITAQSGSLMRKFVDTLPGFGRANANNLGQYIPVAVAEKWIDPNGVTTADDYYEIAAVEFFEQMHSDLPKTLAHPGTKLRGYVQLETAANAATSAHIALTYPDGSPILKSVTDPVTGVVSKVQVLAYDNPHHLGPVINSTKGTTVRVKFTNYLPIGGRMFLPLDTTLPGAGLGPDGNNSYTQNRAGMHLVGGQAPWVSAGSPHQWVAPAGENTPYKKGASSQSAPDMLDPGDGSVNLVFPNDMSARFTFIQDRTSGMTRLNAYAGLEAAYMVTDPIEQMLINGGTLSGGGLKTPLTVAAGTLPAAQIPLIIEDKTFVPKNIGQQDALWNDPNWGTAGDLWFPHVYEPNQDPLQAGGANPVGRWDYGPLFWPIFPVHPAKATLPSPSFVPEAYHDTPVINGTAYPTLTVEPKAYRMRLLNASNDRYINLGLYKADPSATLAPLLDANGNPVVNAAGAQQFMTGTEVKMVPAAPIDTAGSPPGWDPVAGVQTPLPQFGATFPWNINAEPSGPTRAWPVDGRAGGAPDPATAGPDFIVIGNDGGLLPQGVDIPSQPVTYEQNRRSITVLNIYGYGLLLGPSERADTVVDFSAYAGQTLILYNDAPAPTPFNDPRVDYYTGNPDLSAAGGAYSTLPGYGPNTRTMMQIKVGNAVTPGSGGPLDAAALAAALPAAYAASQPAPIVPEVAYNAAFGTTDTDNYGRVATGSAAQPSLVVNHSGGVVLTGFSLITSGGAGTGSGSGYATPPVVVLTGGGGTGATATTTLNAAGQVSAVNLTSAGSGYNAAPTVTFVPNNSVSTVLVTSGGAGYTAPVTVTLTGGGLAGPTVVPASVALAIAGVSTAIAPAPSAPVVTAAGSGYLVPPTVTFSAPTGTVTSGTPVTATGVASISTSPLVAGAYMLATPTVSNYTNPTATITASQNGTTAAVSPIVGYALAPIKIPTGGFLSSNNTGFDLASVSISFSPAATQPVGVTAVLPTTAVAGALTVDPITGAVIGINLSTPGSAMVGLPVATIQDGQGNSLVVPAANLAFAPATGQVFGATVTNGGSGYSAPATIAFTDATGASTSIASVPTSSATVGQVTGLTVTSGGSGYTSAPLVTLKDTTTGLVHTGPSAAAVAVSLSTSPGSILSVNNLGMPPAAAFTSGIAGFNQAPVISFAGGSGVGALASVGIAPVGVGAQATAMTATSVAIPVLTKAEQELFDDYGRYNSTGGVELPFTTAAIQTTIPLGYIDSPTEILGDDEMQIWKLVDNGLWTNSVHFSGWDVQLVNRVGWDGTVKAPASNEVGWKDTVRLNPLEDIIIAMRAKTPQVAFGQPQSTRLQDPTKAQNTGNFPTAPAAPVAGTQYASGLGFLADPNVVTQAGTMNSAKVGVGTPLLTTSTNTAALAGSTTGNFDNEFVWGSAILGHSENDLTRPVVFNPLVITPSQPTALADVAGNGTLKWTDPTPATISKANPQNEIGFKVQRAPITNLATYALGTWTTAAAPFATVPANVVSYKEPAALVAPNLSTYYAYQVVGYNAAGDSAPSNIWYEAPPLAPTGPVNPKVLGLTTGFIVGSTSSADTQLTANWTDNANNEKNYIITKTGPSLTPPVNGKVTGTVATFTAPANTAAGATNTVWVDPNALTEGSYYEYDVVARNAFGDSTPVLSGTVQAPYYAPPAPTNVTVATAHVTCPAAVPSQCAPDDVTVSWTDNAFNELGYQVYRNGVQIGTITGTTPPVTVAGNAANTTGVTMTYVDHTAQEGVAYTYTVDAINSVGPSTQVASTPAVLTLAVMPTTLPTNVSAVPDATHATGYYPDTVALNWSDNAYTESNYQITRAVVAPSPANLIATMPPVTFNASGSGANNPMGTKTASWTASPTVGITDTGLIDGVTYQWTIAGLNNSAAGTATATAGVFAGAAATVTKTMPGVIVNPPANLLATPNRAGASIGLQWTDMSTNESDFLVEEQVSTDGGLTFYSAANAGALNGWTALPPVVRSAAQMAATGGVVNFARANVPTTAGYVYNFRVSARNAASFSDSHPYLTAQASLASPVLTAAPTLAVPTVSTTGRVTLNWTAVTPPAGTTISYRINLNGTPLNTNLLTYSYRPTIAALQAGVTYSVQAVATAIRVANPTVFGATVGPVSNVQSFQASMPAAPAVPTGLAANSNAATGATTLSWTAVAPATGTTVSYLVSVNGAAGVPMVSGAALAVAKGASYQVTVATVATKLGLSTTSAYSAPITVDLTAAATPNAPATLTVNATTLNWTAPVALAGSGSTNVTYTYNVQKSVDGGSTWTLLTAAPITARTLAVASPVGTNYQYQVQAIATRYGLPSATSAWKTTTYSIPAANSTPVAASAVGSKAVTVAWTNASTNITGWTVTRSINGGAYAAFTPTPALPLTGGSYTFTDTGVAVGTRYTYRVTAIAATASSAVATSNQVTAR
jgi:hypothetical protein